MFGAWSLELLDCGHMATVYNQEPRLKGASAQQLVPGHMDAPHTTKG
jgi:hypothetical protein